MSQQRTAFGAFAFHCRHLSRPRPGRHYYRGGGLSGCDDGPPSSKTFPRSRHSPSSSSEITDDTKRLDDDSSKGEPTAVVNTDDDEDELRRAVAVAVPELLGRKYYYGSAAASPPLDLLAALNGYEPIHAPAPPGRMRIPLGEGVIAEGRKGLERDYTVFARRTKTTTRSTRIRHPPFTTEDSTLYRILETRVEERFNRREERVRHWYEEKSRRAKSAYGDVVRRAHGLVVAHRSASSHGQDGSAGGDEEGSSDDYDPDSIVNGPDQCHPSSHSKGERPIVAESEDLLIHCRDGQVLLVEDVPPRHHGLLVLPRAPSLPNPEPYRLRHGRSGTVLYGGLVLFGALPLTYRSASFALDHPMAARAVAASVVGSVSYSLWTSRRAARTRRSLAVAEASASRIVARDEAARLVLMDGAVGSVADAVVGEYLSRLKQGGDDERGDGGGGDGSSERNEALLTFVDPVEIAADLGLLVRCNSGPSGVWTAADLRTARSGLYRRTLLTDRHEIRDER